ncbi:MAG: hypothetical protein RIQ97_2691 [Pseudomonadota bacterium]|jgi:Flp pilus assembly protein TadB
MGIWIELGVFVLALAFGLWQIHDVKKAREATRRAKEQAEAAQKSGNAADPAPSSGDQGPGPKA